VLSWTVPNCRKFFPNIGGSNTTPAMIPLIIAIGGVIIPA
jgi:hypothetical protein